MLAMVLQRTRRSIVGRLRTTSWRAFEDSKRWAQNLGAKPTDRQIFIFGCQRSGTTHLERLFRADPRSAVFGEFSDLSIGPRKTAWRPLDEVMDRCTSTGATYTVARSLYASHRATEILDAAGGSGAIAVWMYREPHAVVASMIRKWGPDFREVSRSVESDAEGRWDLADFWTIVAQLSDDHYDQEGCSKLRNFYGAYWYLRNRTFFDLNLDQDARIMPVDYASLVADPDAFVQAMRDRIGLSAPPMAFPIATSTARAPRRDVSGMSARLETLCDDLYARLRAAERPA
ncbi:sulfotransferase family protein [Rubrivirga sp.]|uniref:sulfotransferase family protein n=1 Tax=Rubrivirga sp. TaxID=1885344 RepID=UPI003C75C1F2